MVISPRKYTQGSKLGVISPQRNTNRSKNTAEDAGHQRPLTMPSTHRTCPEQETPRIQQISDETQAAWRRDVEWGLFMEGKNGLKLAAVTEPA